MLKRLSISLLMALSASLIAASAQPPYSRKNDTSVCNTRVCDIKSITYCPRSIKDLLIYGRAAHCQLPGIMRAGESWAAAEQKDVDFGKGNQLLFAGKWDEAIASYDHCLERNPTSVSALNNRATAYVMKLIFEKRDPLKFFEDVSITCTKEQSALKRAAVADLARALELRPDCALLHRNRAAQLACFATLDVACQEATQSVALAPNDVVSLYSAAGYHNMAGKLVPALRYVDRAIAISADSPLLFTERAVIEFRLGQYQKAVEDVDRALKREPTNAFAWREKGVALMAQRHFKEAKPALLEALRLKPDYGAAYQMLALADLQTGACKEAVDAAQKAITCGGDRYECNYLTGMAYGAMNQPAPAMASFDQALARNPRGSKVYLEKAKIYLSMKERARGMSCLNQCLDLNPNNAEALALRARLTANSGDIEQSVSDLFESNKLQAAAKPKPHFVRRGDFSLEIGLGQEKTGTEAAANFMRGVSPGKAELLKAIAGYSKIIALRGKDASPYFSRGVLRICAGDSIAAIKDLKEARRLSAGNRIDLLSMLLIADLLRQEKQSEQAGQLLESFKTGAQDVSFARLVNFERGALGAAELLKTASPATAGWAHYFVARKLLNAGKVADARSSLLWLKEHSELESEEYSLAMAQLSRLPLCL